MPAFTRSNAPWRWPRLSRSEITVVKCGGAAGVDLAAVAADTAGLIAAGRALVLVHGGSEEATRLGRRMGVEPRYLTAVSGVRSRYTDEATLDVLTMAMTGRINPTLVLALARSGVRAVGLSGLDGGLVEARRKSALRAVTDGKVHIVRDDLSGRVTRVNDGLLRTLLGEGYVPVISPPALDPVAGLLNVDADAMAACVALALRASCLVILSNVPGLLRDPADPDSLIAGIAAADLNRLMPLAQGRMKPKLTAAGEALAGGVDRVIIGDGRLPQPISRALGGSGTTIRRDAADEMAVGDGKGELD